MIARRVVTGEREGKCILLADSAAPATHHYTGWPGHATATLWSTTATPETPVLEALSGAIAGSFLPQPGETRLLMVRFPPDAIFADPRFDPDSYARELETHVPGFGKAFEPDHPGMHRTDSVDYDIVVAGEIWLELDDGVEVHLRQGDVVIQGGGRHAWRNKAAADALMAFIMVGARRA